MWTRDTQQGYAALISTIIALGVSLSIVGGLAFFTFREININKNFVRSLESYYAAEGGIEDAVYRIISGKQISSGENLNIGGATSTISITIVGNSRIVRAEGVKSSFQQNIETKIDTTTSGASFYYGVQVGAGGLEMENSSKIIGNVYSNGNIIGKNKPDITGDAVAAGISRIEDMAVGGNARAHKIEKSTVGVNATSTDIIDDTIVQKDAYTRHLEDATITQNAYFMTKDAQTVILGSQFPNTPAPSDVSALAMPIPDSTITEWKNSATAGGIYNGPCPLEYGTGDVVTLGPKQINCDVVIQGSAKVTIAGPLWIKGNVDFKNTSETRLASSFGDLSGVIIADNPASPTTKGLISIQNSAVIAGSGNDGSYLMLVSGNTSAESGGDLVAIELKNSGTAAIYYAPHGLASVGNTTSLKEVTAWKLSIKNTATITYESGLQNMQFSSGPSGGFDIQYWKKTE